MNAERRLAASEAASRKSFGGDIPRVTCNIVAPPGLPLWLAVDRGYRLAPPGPTTEDERLHLSHEARDRARGYELACAYGRQYLAEFGGAA